MGTTTKRALAHGIDPARGCGGNTAPIRAGVGLLFIAPVVAGMVLAALSTAKGGKPQPRAVAEEWVKLPRGEFVKGEHHDGDSFSVRLADGSEEVFRISNVDAPETDPELVKRLKQQAKYFGVPGRKAERVMLALGREAKEFTAEKLRREELTIYTKWVDAGGAGPKKRYFATIRYNDGKDLSRELVEAGLARITGVFPIPDAEIPGKEWDPAKNRNPREERALLEKLEASAKEAKRGGWEAIRQGVGLWIGGAIGIVTVALLWQVPLRRWEETTGTPDWVAVVLIAALSALAFVVIERRFRRR